MRLEHEQKSGAVSVGFILTVALSKEKPATIEVAGFF
jgi:hypothetical protein